MPFTTVDGANVHYASHPGGGLPVVFLHGGFGSSSELWQDTITRLPAEYQAFALDNFLRSDPPPGGYNVSAFADRAAGFIRGMGLGRAVLVGHSMGGVVSQLTALNHPDVVAGLVLVCTGASMTNHQLGRDLLDELRTGGATPETIRSISGHWFRTAPTAFFDEYVALATEAPIDAMISVQESLISTDLRPRLGEIRAPTLVVWGAHDTGRTIEHATALLDGIPGSRLSRMEVSGHTPMVETPDAFDTSFHAFLATVAHEPVPA